MKKIVVCLTFILCIFMLCPDRTFAKTISDLRKELELIEQKEKENNQDINMTQSEINSVSNEISKIYSSIENITSNMKKLEDEIIKLNENIEKKDIDTKTLLASLQKTEGNSFYLEYLFGSTSIEDFIYRYSITEQITGYNNDLIKEMNELIKSNEAKKSEFANKQIELKEQQKSLSTRLTTLSNSKVKLYELGSSIEDEIRNARSVIQMYINAGCSENDDINVCANRLLPPDTRFWRPIEVGYVTSEFGWRNAIWQGGYLVSSSGLHEGIDLSSSTGTGTKLYSIANGMVAAVWYDIWGGNQVTIHHNVNGVKYSSSYAHMSEIYVKVGEVVTKDSIVGAMGSTGSATGPHLHIAISTGLRFKDSDQLYYSQYASKCVNPRNLINFPSYENPWYNRINYYS